MNIDVKKGSDKKDNIFKKIYKDILGLGYNY